MTHPGSEGASLHATVETPAILTRGSQLGRYVVLEVLGSGGSGVVFSAFDPVLERKVAVKLLHTSASAKLAAVARARLLREAKAMAKVTHPHVVTVHDAGELAGQVFIAMELVQGSTLALWSGEKIRGWREVLALYLQAGRGLIAIHAAGLVHRDFKPANVLLRDAGHALVTDFGLASIEEGARAELDAQVKALASSTRSTLTMDGMLIGTPAYMAPEQIICERADARSDQFSFCVALWESLHGVRPFAQSDTLGKLFEEIRAARLSSAQGRQVPGWLREVLARGLSADPAARFESMDALLAALEQGTRPQRARWMAAGAVALGLVTVAGGFAAWRTSQQRACELAAHEIDSSWTARREAIGAAFHATGIGHADAAFSSIRPVLDGYSSRWSALRSEACLASRLGGATEGEVAPRVVCLARRRSQLDAFVRLLEHPTPELVTLVPSAVHSLASIESCVRGDGAAATLPEAPDLRAQVLALRDRLDVARVRFDAGQFREGAALIQPIVDEARQLGFAPLLVESLGVLGQYQHRLTDPGAEATLIEAAKGALAIGADDEAFEAWLLLAVVAIRANEVPAGERWLGLADAILERGGGSPEKRAQLEAIRSGVLRAAGKPEQALAAADRAVDLWRVTAPGSPMLAGALEESGVNLSELGRLREALARDEEILKILEAAAGPDHPDTGRALGNLCAAQRALGNRAAALAACERSLAIRERVLGPQHLELAPALNTMAVLANGVGDTEKAAVLHRRALAIREASLGPDHPLVALQLSNLAATLRRTHPDESLELVARVLAICERAKTGCEAVVPFTLLYRADIALETGRLSAARADFELSLARFTAAFGPEHPDLGDALLGLGRVELAARNPRAAVTVLERAMALGQKAPGRAKWPQLRFFLARALWESRQDPERAHALAEAATEGLTDAPTHAALREDIVRWLAAHPVGATPR